MIALGTFFLLIIGGFILLRRHILAMPPEPSHDDRDVSIEEIMGALPPPSPGRTIRDKPQMRLSQVRPIVNSYVEETSRSAKEQPSTEKKRELVDSLISRLKARGIYDFIDQ